jgi:hypothetical protein
MTSAFEHFIFWEGRYRNVVIIIIIISIKSSTATLLQSNQEQILIIMLIKISFTVRLFLFQFYIISLVYTTKSKNRYECVWSKSKRILHGLIDQFTWLFIVLKRNKPLSFNSIQFINEDINDVPYNS